MSDIEGVCEIETGTDIAVAEVGNEPEFQTGDVAGESEVRHEIDTLDGFSRYRDPITAELASLASAYDTVAGAAQAHGGIARTGAPSLEAFHAKIAKGLESQKESVGRVLRKTLAKHALGPWCAQHLGGVHVARVISMIGDPLRFPGRICANDHYMPADWRGPCGMPLADRDFAPCGADVSPVRRGTGVRSLYHYCGLHVIDGKLALKKKGVQCTWNTAARTALLMPQGIADQVIMQRCEPYRTTYDTTKERLLRERGAEKLGECGEGDGPTPRDLDGGVGMGVVTESRLGAAVSSGDGAESGSEIEIAHGPIPQYKAHQIARIVAVKAWIGDLLIEWKGLVG